MTFAALTEMINPPLYVVTADDGTQRSGCLVGFATQCSIYPPRFLVCLSVLNHTAPVAAAATTLGVHLLTSDDHDLAAHFGGLSGDETDKFAGIAWHRGPGGAPLLSAVSGAFEGTVLAHHDFGDHVGYVLAPLQSEGGPPADGPGQLTLHDADDIVAGHPPDERRAPGA